MVKERKLQNKIIFKKNFEIFIVKNGTSLHFFFTLSNFFSLNFILCILK